MNEEFTKFSKAMLEIRELSDGIKVICSLLATDTFNEFPHDYGI